MAKCLFRRIMRHRKLVKSRFFVLIVKGYENSSNFRRLLDGQSQAPYITDMKHLAEWVKQSNIDPCDPENAFLINLVKVYNHSKEKKNLLLKFVP